MHCKAGQKENAELRATLVGQQKQVQAVMEKARQVEHMHDRLQQALGEIHTKVDQGAHDADLERKSLIQNCLHAQSNAMHDCPLSCCRGEAWREPWCGMQ